MKELVQALLFLENILRGNTLIYEVNKGKLNAIASSLG